MSNQEYTHLALGGIVREASTRPDGVREISDFEVHEASLVPAEQACQRRPPSPEGLDAAIRALAGNLAANHRVSIEQAESDVRYAVKKLTEKEEDLDEK